MISRVVRIVALLPVLAGCANPQAEQALSAQSALVGMPKAALLSCAGVPARSAALDNLDYFTYHSDRIVSYPGSAFGFYGGGYPWGYPAYYGSDIQSYSCDATFTLRNGVVEKLVYSGNLSQCHTIIGNCLAMLPQQTRPLGAGPALRR